MCKYQLSRARPAGLALPASCTRPSPSGDMLQALLSPEEEAQRLLPCVGAHVLWQLFTPSQ